MRWATPKKCNRYRERRTRRVFLLLPLTLRGETRWLEHATIVESYSGRGYWAPLYWEDTDAK